MKFPVLFFVGVLGLGLAGSGCGHISITPEGDPNRVLKGVVSLPSSLPAGTEILVRLLDISPGEKAGMNPRNDLPLGDRGRPVAVDRVLGEYRRVLDTLTTQPVPFELEYEAEDSLLRHGLNVDVRVSFNGRVRFRTISAHVVTLASSPFRHEVEVQPVQ